MSAREGIINSISLKGGGILRHARLVRSYGDSSSDGFR